MTYPEIETTHIMTKADYVLVKWMVDYTGVWSGLRAYGLRSPTAVEVQAFYVVSLEQGLSVNEYARRLKVSKSTMSRMLLNLGASNRKFEPGAGLVTSYPNPRDEREVQYWLTSRGRALATQLAALMRNLQQQLAEVE